MRSVWALLLLTPSEIQAQTVSEVLRQVEAGNIQLQALREEQRAQLQEMKAENTLGETSVEYSPFYYGGSMAESELIVTQEVDFPTQFAARRRVEKRQQTAHERAQQVLRRDILLEAKDACIDLLAAQQRDIFLQRITGVADSLTEAMQTLLQAGAAMQLDLNRVRLIRMEAKTQLADNATARQQACAVLQRLSGGTSVASLTDDGSLDSLALLPVADERPEVQSAEAEQQVASQQVKAQRQGWLPRLNVGYRRNTALGESFHGFQVGGALPLFSQSKQLNAAKHRQAAAQLDWQEARQRAEADIQAQSQEVRQLAQMLSAYDESLLSETLTLLLRSLQLGEISTTDYFTESDILFRKQLERIDLQARYRKAVARLMTF